MHALDYQQPHIADSFAIGDGCVAGTRVLRSESEPTHAVTADRERIARDLHDSVIQRLFGVGLSLQVALKDMEGLSRDRVSDAIDTLDDTINELRSTIFFLTTGSRDRGIRARMSAVTIESETALGFAPQLYFDGPIDAIHPAIVVNLIAVVREALSNVARHAHASNVSVLITSDVNVTVIVLDDGVGCKNNAELGCGLLNMRSRAEHYGGVFALNRGTAGGTHLEWRVPAE